MAARNGRETGAVPLLLEKISLNKTHIVLQDVDGSAAAITPIDLYQFVKDHLQEIEEQRLAYWRAYLNTVEG